MTFKQKVLEMVNQSNRPLLREEIAEHFGLYKRDRKALYDVLRDLEREGLIYRDDKLKYKKLQSDNVYEGVLDMAEGGFGFVMVDGRDQDIFVPEENIDTAMDRDTVLVEIVNEKRGRSSVGRISKILKRATTTLVGIFEDQDTFGFVVPDRSGLKTDIFVPQRGINGAKNGQKVLVEITKYPKGDKSPEGIITNILGYPSDKGVDVLSVALDHGIKLEFSNRVLRQAQNMPMTVSDEEIEGRLDLRDQMIFTIDGADAKDLDDAVSIEKLDNGNYKLGVHIADVSHYVKENSPIDKEARERGNSVYLTDRVVPMLPPELSNGLCSLHPDVDRLCLSVYMEITPSGKVKTSDIKESVIRSKKRLVYTDVSDYLEDGCSDAKGKLGETVESIELMDELRAILNKQRFDRGAIGFDFKESFIEIDENDEVIDIRPMDIRVANKIIEEFMLITNETIAERFFWMQSPFIYRVHEYPDDQRMGEFLHFIRGFGYGIKGGQNEVHPKELQEIIEEIRGKDEEAVIARMMLRSLKKARYSEESGFHFGLSSENYTHFTAPIRRYSDLTIHRIIKKSLKGETFGRSKEKYVQNLKQIADHVSDTERMAIEAERDVIKIKKAEYMEKHIGEEYYGLISGITGFGIFVELENTVEGLVSYDTIQDDYYNFVPERLVAIGENTGNEYTLGQKVKVQVVRADGPSGQVDFVLVGDKY